MILFLQILFSQASYPCYNNHYANPESIQYFDEESQTWYNYTIQPGVLVLPGWIHNAVPIYPNELSTSYQSSSYQTSLPESIYVSQIETLPNQYPEQIGAENSQLENQNLIKNIHADTELALEACNNENLKSETMDSSKQTSEDKTISSIENITANSDLKIQKLETMLEKATISCAKSNLQETNSGNCKDENNICSNEEVLRSKDQPQIVKHKKTRQKKKKHNIKSAVSTKCLDQEISNTKKEEEENQFLKEAIESKNNETKRMENLMKYEYDFFENNDDVFDDRNLIVAVRSNLTDYIHNNHIIADARKLFQIETLRSKKAIKVEKEQKISQGDGMAENIMRAQQKFKGLEIKDLKNLYNLMAFMLKDTKKRGLELVYFNALYTLFIFHEKHFSSLLRLCILINDSLLRFNISKDFNMPKCESIHLVKEDLREHSQEDFKSLILDYLVFCKFQKIKIIDKDSIIKIIDRFYPECKIKEEEIKIRVREFIKQLNGHK